MQQSKNNRLKKLEEKIPKQEKIYVKWTDEPLPNDLEPGTKVIEIIWE